MKIETKNRRKNEEFEYLSNKKIKNSVDENFIIYKKKKWTRILFDFIDNINLF